MKKRKHMRITFKPWLAGTALALFVSIFAGCSGTEKALCDKQRQCMGGNDSDFEACVQNYIYDGKVASDYKCSDAWSNYLTCLSSSATCNTTLRVLEANCGAQATALESCKQASSTKGSKHFITTQSVVQTDAPKTE